MSCKPILKPGPKKKTSKIKNRTKMRLHDIDPPAEKHCRRCALETGTERFAHYEGYRKFEFGKGIGKKINDNLTAWLCQECTTIMDEKPEKYQYTEEKIHSEQWLYLIIKTHLL